MPTGYEDLDNLNNQTNQLYEEQMKQQENMINTSTQQAIDEIERNKQKAEREAEKVNKALYTDYQKQINPYGVNAENLAEQGLKGSGVAESAKTNYYNTYQNARTEATNNANTIKADFDAQIAQARQNGDLQKAQSLLNLYTQRINDLSNIYNLKFQADQFGYQKEQDALAQSNWEKQYQQALQEAQWQQQFNQAQFDYNKEQDVLAQQQWQQQFDYNKSIDDRNYNYQVGRDQVADSQWQKEYDLAKKKSSSSGSSSRSSSSSSGSYSIPQETTKTIPSSEDLLANMTIVQGANLQANIKDKYSGKTFKSVDEMLNYYGYIAVE